MPEPRKPRKPRTVGKSSPARCVQEPTNAYAERAHQYARDVIGGKIIACKWVRLACARHLNDLGRVADPEYPYRFDATKAGHACEFIEGLPHTKGKWARPVPGQANTIHLEGWQVFLVCAIFGWLEKTTGNRRFSDVMLVVARKNAKSTLAAGIGLYMLVADGEYGAEVYSGATTEKQAWEVFRVAWRMAKKTPALRAAFGLEVAAKSLYIEDDGSRFEPIVGDPGDGASPSCAITDEYHEHASAAQYDTMKTGMGARDQPISLVITTAGSNLGGPCYEKQEHLQKVLEGTLEDDSLFGVIYTKDDEDDWTSREAQLKANPNYGISVLPRFLDQQLHEARQQAGKENNYKTKHLNMWCGAATAWLPTEKWNACADTSLSLDDFAGQDCFSGNDLAAKIDMADSVKVFIRGVEADIIDEATGKPRRVTQRHYYVFCTHYLPAQKAFAEDCQHYQKWVKEGWITTTPGVEIQYSVIQENIMADTERFAMRCIAFDPYGATMLRQELEKELPEDTVIEIPQQTKYLSEPMKEVEAAVMAGRLHHNGDPVLRWMISNVKARTDAGGRVFPTKEREQNKIDGAVALIMAVSRAMVATPKKKSVYSSRGLRTL